jgi:ribosome biogenesis protein
VGFLDIKRYGLSRVLNSESMLNTPAPIPLDFLINGSFLQTTLEEYLKANGLSFETTVTLQYVRSLLPPVYQASFEHDDWVSSVDILSSTSPAGVWSGDAFTAGQDRVLSGSYDGLVRIWNPSGQILAISPASAHGGHSKRLNAAKFLSSSRIVSAGSDQKIVVWDYSEGSDHSSGTLKPTLQLYGHKKMIQSLDVNGATTRILSASSDGSIGLWSASKRTAPAVDPETLPSAYSNKRTKISSSVSSAQRGPLALIQVHDDPATAAIFHPEDHTVAYSVSNDHTLKTIDLTTSRVVSTLTTLHPLLSVCSLSGVSAHLVAAGSSARHATLLDPRASATSTSVLTLRGHTNMVVSLARSPENDFSLISGSHDGTCRVWDLRSVRPARGEEGGGSVSEPVYTISRRWLEGKKLPVAGQGAKVLSVAWDKTLGIASGGEDRMVQINSGRDIVENS